MKFINQQTKKESKTKKTYTFIIELDNSKIFTETKSMILYGITDKIRIWIPITNLWVGKILRTVKLPMYKEDTNKYRVIHTEQEGFMEVTLYQLFTDCLDDEDKKAASWKVEEVTTKEQTN